MDFCQITRIHITISILFVTHFQVISNKYISRIGNVYIFRIKNH